MKEVHLILQGKGGVGKSLIASLIAQFLNETQKNLQCFDTDPVNPTFSRYAALNVKIIDLMTPAKTIDSAKFDALIESIILHEGVTVVDNGAATFVPLVAYLLESQAIDLLIASGVKIYVHVPIVGGQAKDDTVLNLVNILKNLACPTVVWINEFWGAINDDITQWASLKPHKQQIKGIIKLKQLNPDTFGRDISKMTSDALLMDQVYKSSDYSLMQKQRIKTFARDIQQQFNDFYLTEHVETT